MHEQSAHVTFRQEHATEEQLRSLSWYDAGTRSPKASSVSLKLGDAAQWLILSDQNMLKFLCPSSSLRRNMEDAQCWVHRMVCASVSVLHAREY